MSRCVVCHSEHRHLVENLAAGGASLETIKSALAEKEIKLPTIGLKRHLKQHSGVDLENLHPTILEVLKSPVQRAEQVQVERQRQAEANEILEAIVQSDSVDVTGFLTECGIKEKPDTVEDVIEADQVVSYRLFQRAAAIADKELQLYAMDRERYRYPTNQLKGLSMLHEMMATAYAYREAVNINVAAKTIHREGGRVLFEATDVAGEVAESE
jgi:hypothetical protein